MNRFAETLHRIADELQIPQPARSRVLLEIAADMEDTYAHLRADGVGEAEARMRTLEMLDLSTDALRHLVRVHASPWKRLLDQASDAVRTRLEWGFLVAVLFAVGAMTLVRLRGASLVAGASAFVWPLAACGLLGAGVALARFYVIWIRRAYRPARLRTGLGILPGAAVACILLGLAGFFTELFVAASHLLGGEQGAWPGFLAFVRRVAPMEIFSLLLASVLALCWFGLERAIGRIESSEAELLVALNGQITEPQTSHPAGGTTGETA